MTALDCCITCCSVHNNNVMTPDMRRVITSIHLDVSDTTCVGCFAWIITTFASDVDIQEASYKETQVNRRRQENEISLT